MQGFLTESDEYIVKPTSAGYLYFCNCTISGLKEQNEIIANECLTYKKMSDNMANELVKLKEQNKKLRVCVEFYADKENYDREGLPHGFCIKFGELLDDYSKATKETKDLSWYGGKRARKCLEEIGHDQALK